MGGKAAKLSPKTLKDLQSHVDVDLSCEEIQDWFKEYQSTLAPGENTMSKADFLGVYNKLFVGDATEFAEQVFRTFDENQDQKVNFREFLVGLCISGSSDPKVKMKWAFQMYDRDGDGYITRDEMEHIFKAISKMTQSELHENSPSAEELTDSIFKSMDKDQDNRISKDEFIEGAQKETIVMDILQCDPNPDANDQLDIGI